MPRPLKEGMDYFPHDTDAASDEKVEALRALYGNDGYAFYFISLERIYRTSSCELDISDAETRQILAKKIGVSVELFEKMLATAFKVGAFDKEAYEERGVLTSNGIKKRAAVVLEKRERMRFRYQQSRERVFAAETGEETGAETRQRKEKKSKEKHEGSPPMSPPLRGGGSVPGPADNHTPAENEREGGAHQESGKGSEAPPAEKPLRSGARQKGGRGEVIPLVPADFDRFWQLYPRRIERLRAVRAWNARIRDGTDPEALIAAARNYARVVADTEERYIKHPATFLGRDRPFEEYLTPPAGRDQDRQKSAVTGTGAGQGHGRDKPSYKDLYV